MSKGLKKYLNLRTLIILSCIVVFILINSVQENYVSIDDIPEGTLITTDTTPPTTSSQPPSSSSPGPTFPTETPSIPDNGGIDSGKKLTIPTQMIPIAITLAIFVFVIFLYLQRKKKVSAYHAKKRIASSTVLSRREKFRTEIKNLVDVLYEFLRKKAYAEGIIFGFHQLDKNMKKVLGVRREEYLTPKEFSNSLDLPEIIPHLDWIVETFYNARYKLSKMSSEDLKIFIEKLEKIKDLSKTKQDIEIISIENLGETK
ncbi:MAG: hypothetical protein ACTSUR_03325 [Candidatus Heimdallarchaeaceae archaeon]